MNDLKTKYDYDIEFENMREVIQKKLYDENKLNVLDSAKRVLSSYDFQNKAFSDTGENYGEINLNEYLITMENSNYIENDKTVYGVKIDSELAKNINYDLKMKYFKILKEKNFLVLYDGLEIKIFLSKNDFFFEKILPYLVLIVFLLIIIFLYYFWRKIKWILYIFQLCR